jgi:hypothetical protein
MLPIFILLISIVGCSLSLLSILVKRFPSLSTSYLSLVMILPHYTIEFLASMILSSIERWYSSSFSVPYLVLSLARSLLEF